MVTINKRAEFNTQGMIIAILSVGLFMGVMAAWITGTSYYDKTGFDVEDLNDYNKLQNLSQTLQTVTDDVDGVTVDSSWFDYFSGMFSKLLRPFKFVYQTFAHMINLSNSAVDTFQLLPVFRQFFTSLVMTLVIVGIVLYKVHLGRQK